MKKLKCSICYRGTYPGFTNAIRVSERNGFIGEFLKKPICEYCFGSLCSMNKNRFKKLGFEYDYQNIDHQHFQLTILERILTKLEHEIGLAE